MLSILLVDGWLSWAVHLMTVRTAKGKFVFFLIFNHTACDGLPVGFC